MILIIMYSIVLLFIHEIMIQIIQEPELRPADFSWNVDYEPSFMWYDAKLVEATRDAKDPTIHMFFRLLALCHTVMPNSRTGMQDVHRPTCLSIFQT